MNIALLIPIYCPSKKVLPFLLNFQREDFSTLLVVDDGSGAEYAPIFKDIAEKTPFTVVSYPINHGKGYALKFGMGRLLKEHPDLDGIVTADGDGQHSYIDILRVRDALAEHPEELVIGARDFSNPNVPARSKGGNAFSSRYFKLYTGIDLSDTQTGLRGVPSSLFELALDEYGSRYEYEMNFLLDSAKYVTIASIPIETIYEDHNEVSHFRPFRDTCRIYRTPILYVLVALFSALVDLMVFYLAQTYMFAGNSWVLTTLYSMLVSRAISGPLNFILNWLFVFPSKGVRSQKVRRYLILFVVSFALSFGFVCLFQYLGTIIVPWAVTLIKLAVDALIAIGNFLVNLVWVFAKKKYGKKKDPSSSSRG